MDRFSNASALRPILRTTLLALLAPATLAGALVHPAAAAAGGEGRQIRIAVAAGEADAERTRRRIASAARAVCGQGGLAGIYRNAARRCRTEVRADAERQLLRRQAPRPLLAASQGR